MSQEVYVLKRTQDSRYRRQLPRNSCFFCVSLPAFCISNLPYVTLLLIAYLWFCTPIVNADRAEEHSIYIINTGDQLLISVVGHETELTAMAAVRPDGMITYPVVGDVKAAGLTVAQLSAAISEQLSLLEFYKDPQVTVQLQKTHLKNIYIFGDVVTPGQMQFPRSVNVVEVLAAAGGFEKTADLANAMIIKRRKEVIPVDLRVLLDDSDAISDKLLDDRFMMEDGDALMIPSTLKIERISVIGYVTTSGHYPVTSRTNLIDALALAGGPIATVADLKNIRLIKPDGSVIVVDITRIWAEGGEEQNPANSSFQQNENQVNPFVYYVEPGDSVVVLEKASVNIVGAVKTYGQFRVDGEISIVEALALAGVEKNANLKKLRIVRSTGERIVIDASNIWEPQRQEAEGRLGPGDTLMVPESFQITWGAISTVVMLFSTMYAIFR